VLGTSESQVPDDGSVGVLVISLCLFTVHRRRTKRSSRLKHISNIIGEGAKYSRHTGLPWDTSGDDDELSTSQSLLDAIIVSQDPCKAKSYSLILLVTLDNRVGVDVGDISSDTWGTSDIVEG
jgi:hypothetical protein